MIEGIYTDNIMMHSETRAYPVEPQISSGVTLGSQAIYRYGLRESSYPTLSLVEEITDGLGNVIPAGHYELALSDERNFLILIQSKEVIAIMPVFLVEADISKYSQVKDNKSLKKQKKQQKEIAKTNAKRAKQGMLPITEDDDIYQDASIEYVEKGNYYLIKYERGDVRAWAAVKSN